MKKIHLGLALIHLLMLACSPRWSAETCSQTDFNQLGYTEGSQGKASHVDAYNQSCLKKKVNINITAYNLGYLKGLDLFCSASKGKIQGSQGKNPSDVCLQKDVYMKAYESGLKGFCSSEKGTADGYNMNPMNQLCTSYYAYKVGYKAGVKQYCSFERGLEDGFAGKEPLGACMAYPYSKGHKKGQANFCLPENGLKLGQNGTEFPVKCEATGGYAFKKAFNKGRIEFLSMELRSKETSLKFERQNYEQQRDELQDLQFAIQRLPKYSQDPAVLEERKRIDQKILNLQNGRNEQRRKVNNLETEIINIKAEISSLN